MPIDESETFPNFHQPFDNSPGQTASEIDPGGGKSPQFGAI
jgi:hypothetical protein